MLIKLLPQNKSLTTSLPLTLEIKEASSPVSVTVEKLGKIAVKEFKKGEFKSEFYFVLPGAYQVIIKDQQETSRFVIQVEKQEYLNFNQEFGFFFFLFLLVMMGVILWVKKIMKQATKKI